MNEQTYKYVIVEIQTMANGQIGALVTAKDDYYEAESTYHSVLASAAISNLPCHTALLCDNKGGVIHAQCFEHPQAEPEQESE